MCPLGHTGPAQAETRTRCQTHTAAGAEGGSSAPERRVLFADPAPAGPRPSHPGATPPPSTGEQAARACKGKMPAEENPGGMQGHHHAGGGGGGTGAGAAGSAMNFLDERKRQLGEAMEDVAKSSAALDEIIVRSRKRRGGCGESWSASCHGAARESGIAHTEEGREGAGGARGGRGADLVEELLESILRAGDERLSSEARSRAASSAAAQLQLPPTASAAAVTSSSAAAAAAAAPASATASGHADRGASAPDAWEGGDGMASSGDALLLVTNWSRCLVRRADASGGGGGGGAIAGGRGGRGSEMVWRVRVSGICSRVTFALSFLVHGNADMVQLETVEVLFFT